MVESKKNVKYELNQSLFEVLKENLRNKENEEPVQLPLEGEESEQTDKERLLKRWKESAGNFGLNPDKFRFSLKNL